MDCPCSGGVKSKSVNGSSVLSCCEGNTVASLSLEYTSKRSVFVTGYGKTDHFAHNMIFQ